MNKSQITDQPRTGGHVPSVADLAQRRAKSKKDALLRVRVEPALLDRLQAVEEAARDRGLEGITVSYLVREAVSTLLDGIEEELDLGQPTSRRKPVAPKTG